MDGEDDEPVTPAGRFFLRPEMQQVINCVVGLKNPVDVDAIKAEIEDKLLKLHPRFSCVLVRDRRGREYWRKASQVNLDSHVIVISEEEEDCDQDFVNNYVADLTVSTPLDLGKPLWEVHLLPSHRCCVLRLHHALGDGISLMSLFLASCERADEPHLPLTIPGGMPTQAAAEPFAASVWRALLVVWYTLVYVVEMALRSLWVKDVTTPISGGAGVELWPRKLATATFCLADIKVVKGAVQSTINDVILGVISNGLAKYLELRSPKKMPKVLRITGLAMVNTRKHPGLQDLSSMMMRSKSKSQWGNQFGFVLLPICLQKGIAKPLEYVERAKAMMNKKKLSLEAHFSYRGGAFVMSLLGPKVATAINYRIISNTSFTFSNMVGPSEEITFAKNPITYLRGTSNGLPHAITLHMISYMGKADMQILVAKDIIPDPEVLAKYFQDALVEMKTIVANRS